MPLSYWQVHYELKTRRGKASDHTCACGRPAQDWAFRGDPVTALISETGTGIGCVYSEDIENDYRAECRSCHHTADMTDARRETSRRNAASSFGKSWSRPGPRGSTKTNAMTYRCAECGLETTPGPMALHLRKLGHSGSEKVAA